MNVLPKDDLPLTPIEKFDWLNVMWQVICESSCCVLMISFLPLDIHSHWHQPQSAICSKGPEWWGAVWYETQQRESGLRNWPKQGEGNICAAVCLSEVIANHVPWQLNAINVLLNFAWPDKYTHTHTHTHTLTHHINTHTFTHTLRSWTGLPLLWIHHERSVCEVGRVGGLRDTERES